jgi:hypothetical protein
MKHQAIIMTHVQGYIMMQVHSIFTILRHNNFCTGMQKNKHNFLLQYPQQILVTVKRKGRMPERRTDKKIK